MALAVVGVMGFAAVMVSAPLTVAPLKADRSAVAGVAASPHNLDPEVLANARECGLTEAQCKNAKTIIEVGKAKGVPDRGIVIALAVALQESQLKMLANDGTDTRLKPEQKDVGKSLNYPHEGVGRDHGSVNFMQQQYPGWGSLDELMNPEIAAAKFYDALLRVKGWEKMSVTKAAQTVQRSAYPDAYAKQEKQARTIFNKLES